MMNDDKKPDFYADRPVTHPEFRKGSSPSEEKGDGDPNCNMCFGAGIVYVTTEGPPVVQRCKCVRKKDIALRVEEGWKGLLKASNLEEPSPLLSRVADNMWVRASISMFRQHMKYVSIRHLVRNSKWFFVVETDADLMQAWLATAVADKAKIFDPDVKTDRHSLRHLALEDLVMPPDLLVIHLGVKRAANKEMSGVLFESLSMRYNRDKPTWIFDQPHSPFQEGHLAWSYPLQDHIEEVWEYEYLDLGGAYSSGGMSGTGSEPFSIEETYQTYTEKEEDGGLKMNADRKKKKY